MGDENEVIDRRTAIEAAFVHQEAAEAVETPEAAAPPPPSEPVESPAPEQKEAAPASEAPAQKASGKEPTAAPLPEGATFPVDKAPQSWRAPARAKWDKVDPEIRQEVMKRERETTKVLGETAQVRQFANNFNQVVQPYMARMNAMGLDPLGAVHELLKGDYLLATAPKAQKAQLMAKLINDYGVDIMELDSALAGKGPADPVDSRVEQLLQERLKPFQQYIQNQQRQAQENEQHSQQEVNQTIESMTDNPKYPHFDTVRLDMADAIDLAAKRGLYLTLDQAYNRAIAMNPEVSSQVAAQQQAEAKRTAAQQLNAKAQRALGASVSVGGAPSGVPSGASGATDRRATIEAAFEQLSGR
jgi:hypothetical protein